MRVLCIYHANCADGFGAAFAVKTCLDRFNIPVEFHAANYGSAPPDVTDANVVIVDFSYPMETLLKIKHRAKTVLILDHHKSAQADLASVPKAEPTIAELAPGNDFAAIFDMNRSGAGITWDFFSNNQPRPRLIDHIEDYDLWRFDLEGSKEIVAALYSHPFDFDLWATFDVDALREEGKHIRRAMYKNIDSLMPHVHRLNIAGYEVPAVCAPYFLVSEMGELLSPGEDFVALYSDSANHRIFSLRSEKGAVDVSAIAKLYGGGGHANAAAFKVPLEGTVFNEPV